MSKNHNPPSPPAVVATDDPDRDARTRPRVARDPLADALLEAMRQPARSPRSPRRRSRRLVPGGVA